MLFTVLSAAVKPIELVGNLAAGAAGAVFPPSSLCFGAVMYLINAAKGVSASLDAIAGLLEVLKDFTVRLKVYQREDLSAELREKLTDILVTILDVFARSTKVIKDGVLSRFKAFGKGVLLGSDTTLQGLMGKLGKLTESEGRLVGAEALVETKKTARGVGEIQQSVGDVKVGVHGIQQGVDQLSLGVGEILSAIDGQNKQSKDDADLKQYEILKKALRPSSTPMDRFDEIRREHVPSSGDWIKHEQNLESWMSSESATPILWVSGNPGSGKSLITYTIVTHLQEFLAEQTDIATFTSVGYFFFRDNKDATRSFEQALRDVSFQIAQKDQVYAKHVVNCVQKDSDIASIRSIWQRLFVDFFLTEDNEESTAFVVLDGIDEAFAEDRATFFELLRDVEAAGSQSRLHVAMIGRPQIIDELSEQLENSIPTIYIDGSKNSDDIFRYIEASIAKSKVLRRVSQKLKEEIATRMASAAGGMYMWCKLMLNDLSKKTRESAMREALDKAPKGLTEMLRHVFEGFSATLTEEDASDLNDMLAWVAFAKRPLTLGEIDAVLRLKSEDGDGVIYLEGKLRKQFASFFTLTREDYLTTADLQASKALILDEEDTEAGAAEEEGGEDDVDNETDFESNLKTTTVSFSHASISDFLRDPKEGKITASGEDHPAVGVDSAEAKFQIARTCLDLLIGKAESKINLPGIFQLRAYAAVQWADHLGDLDITRLEQDQLALVGVDLARLLMEDPIIHIWCGAIGDNLWYSASRAIKLMAFLTSEEVRAGLSSESATWIKSVEHNPIELFEPAVKYHLERWIWLPPPEWNAAICARTIYIYLRRKKGEVIEKAPWIYAESVEESANWLGREQTAEWHRKVALTLREYAHYDAALGHFTKALEMGHPNVALVQGGMCKTYVAQEKYDEAIELETKLLELLNGQDKAKMTPTELVQHESSLWTSCKRMAESCDTLAKTKDDDIPEKIRLFGLALDYYERTLALRCSDYQAVNDLFEVVAYLVDQESLAPVEDNVKTSQARDTQEYYEQVMKVLHTLDEAKAPDRHTHLTHCTFQFKWEESLFFKVAMMSAKGTDQLDWLHRKYMDAVAAATQDLQPVTATYLGLCLAQLRYELDEDESRALQIWENIGASKALLSSSTESEINYARIQALNSFARTCLHVAVRDGSTAEGYIARLERVVARRKPGIALGPQASLPPSDAALYLAAWYRKTGDTQRARELVRDHVKEAIAILSNDDPSDDSDGFYNVTRAFTAAGDEANGLAVMNSLRQYKNGMAVIEGDSDDEESDGDDEDGGESSGSDSTPEHDQSADNGGIVKNETSITDDTTKGDGSEHDVQASGEESKSGGEEKAKADGNEGSEDSDDEDETGWGCDGPCGDGGSYNFDGAIRCRYCLWDLCKPCYKRIMEGTMPLKMCSNTHDFAIVPALTAEQRFKQGEMLLGTETVTVDEWKTRLKKEYSL